VGAEEAAGIAAEMTQGRRLEDSQPPEVVETTNAGENTD
jgi:hypothetical protein